jgi:hypothetical protein
MGSPEDSNKTDSSKTTDPRKATDSSKPADPSKPEETGEETPSPQPDAAQDDRRALERTETILSEIEDATYKVLRKHQDKKTE